MINFFVVVFLFVWLSGWTVGGVVACQRCLARDVSVAVFVVWLVMTSAFAYPLLAPAERCVGTGIWFSVWIMLSAAGAGYFNFNANLVRVKTLVFLRRTYLLATRLAQPFQTRVPRERSHRLVADVKAVSVFLPSGAPVLVGYEVLSHDYVIMLREAVEAKLSLRGQKCRLLFDNRMLADEWRFCDVGLTSGSCITAVIVDAESGATQQQHLSEDSVPPLPIRCFLMVWICGWTVGEVLVLCTLQSMLLGCETPLSA